MVYQIKLIKNIKKGFTLIEIIIVIGIIGLLASISMNAYTNSKSHENLQTSTLGLVEAVRHAQSNAQSGKLDSSWGVKLNPSEVVVFKGSSYTARDSSLDQLLGLPSGVVVTGLSEIVFSKIIGNTTNTGTITVTSGSEIKNITINEKGTITY